MTASPSIRRLANATALASALVAAVSAAALAAHAWRASYVGWRTPGDGYLATGSAFDWSRATDQRLGVVLIGSLLITALAYRSVRRRRQTSASLVSVVVLVTITVLFGGATYIPADVSATPVLAPLAWLLALFVGAPEESALLSTPYPVAFELARGAGITATFTGVIAATWSTWQRQSERLRLRYAGELDVVTGSGPEVLPLIKTLVDEADAWTRRPSWHSSWPTRTGDLGRALRSRPSVFYVTDSAGDPIIGAARLAGAATFVGDLTDARDMRRLLLKSRLRGARRVSTHRLFLLGPDQDRNIAMYDVACDVLTADSTLSHDRDVVPRLVVRMDDPREAHDWRIARAAEVADPQMAVRPSDDADEPAYFTDAVSRHEVVASGLADVAADHGFTRVVLVGEGPVNHALLDALAFRCWRPWNVMQALLEARPELADTVRAEWDRCLELRIGEIGADPGAVSDVITSPWPRADERQPVPLREVVIVGPTATVEHDAWLRVCPPWVPEPDEQLDVRPLEVAEDAVERAVASLLDVRAQPALVIVQSSTTAGHALARRVATFDPNSVVLASDDRSVGVTLPLTPGSVGGYGPSWVASDGEALEDSWSRFARQQHLAFVHVQERRDEHRPARRPWSARTIGDATLPAFFKQDNLRQIRRVLRAVPQGELWEWALVSADNASIEQPNTDAHHALVERIARSEHRRWHALRVRNGWIAPGEWTMRDRLVRADRRGDQTDSGRLRINRNLASSELADADLYYNISQVEATLAMLGGWGLVPRLCGTSTTGSPTWSIYERCAEVLAVRLSAPRSWTPKGGEQLSVDSGDWWVTELDGSGGRGVAAHRFDDLYAPSGGERYRAHGLVQARRLNAARRITTLEGITAASAGDWVVDDGTSSWPVPAGRFDQRYRAVPLAAASDVTAPS